MDFTESYAPLSGVCVCLDASIHNIPPCRMVPFRLCQFVLSLFRGMSSAFSIRQEVSSGWCLPVLTHGFPPSHVLPWKVHEMLEKVTHPEKKNKSINRYEARNRFVYKEKEKNATNNVRRQINRHPFFPVCRRKGDCISIFESRLLFFISLRVFFRFLQRRARDDWIDFEAFSF